MGLTTGNGANGQKRWSPQSKFGQFNQQTGGYFSSPVRFYGAVGLMLFAFVAYVSYLNAQDSLQPAAASAASSSSSSGSSSSAQRGPVAAVSMSLADLDRLASQAAAQKTTEVDEDDDQNEEEEETKYGESSKSGRGDPESVEAENAAAATDLMSNEAYPTYELPKGGNALNQVQEERSASDIPDVASQVDTNDEKHFVDDDDIMEDAEAYRRAPIIQAMSESPSLRYREIVLQHERYYRSHPSRLYVPRLRKTARLSISQFHERFAKHSQPVIIPFEAMRHLGFATKSYTLDELLEMYPNYKRTFVYRYGSPGPGELDLGPAVWALKQGDALRKTATGRNFPRNTKITLDKLARLKVQPPPYVIPGTPMLLPSLWFATITSSTKFHSDCCDNFAMMISGTKRWTLSPPNEARLLTPACFGGLCWVKKLEHPDEHAKTEKEQEMAAKLQKVTFDLRPGEMLFLPTGWFHHVENLGPTIMINFWTKGGPTFLKWLDGSMLQTITDLQKQESAQRAL